jgi:DnaJ family protein C protein 9
MAAEATSDAVPERFRGIGLYELFSVANDASEADIKKGFRKAALKIHPDLNNATNATAEFQYLTKCYQFLLDPDHRADYDATGCGPGDSEASTLRDVANGVRSASALVKRKQPISAEEIDAFKSRYQGSDEELADLRRAWKLHRPNLKRIFEVVLFAEEDAVERLCDRLRNDTQCRARISEGDMLACKAAMQKKKATDSDEVGSEEEDLDVSRETDEAVEDAEEDNAEEDPEEEEEEEEAQAADEASLIETIQQRQRERQAQLAAQSQATAQRQQQQQHASRGRRRRRS